MTLGNKQRGIATIGLVLLLVLAGCASGGGGGGTGGGGGSAGSAVDAGGGGSGGAPAAGGSGASDDLAAASYYVDGERVVIREASMVVTVEPFDPAFDRARAIAREHDGFVADWELDVDEEYHRATLQVRVPAENFNDARDEFAGLGTVESERVDAKDFTSEHTGMVDRLEELRQRESDLESDLEATDDPQRSRDIREQLDDVRSEIRSLESDRQSLERRASMSTIELTLREPASNRRPPTYESALGVQLSVLTAFFAGLTVVKYVLAAVGFVAPVALTAVAVGAVGLVSVRLTRRAWSGFDGVLREYGLDPAGSDETRDELTPEDRERRD